MRNFKRIIQLPDLTKQTVFLWGPRKTGKSYFIKHFLATEHILIDLLKADVFAEYSLRPSLLRERYGHDLTKRIPIVIDEVQKCPALLDEVHWLIENSNQNFLLTGSSARKLKRIGVNLLGGRAWRRELRPLSYAEIPDFEIGRALSHGLIPNHYLSSAPEEELRGYFADYLKEEIAEEASIRNLPVFGDFLRIAALNSGQILNYNNVANDLGIKAKTIKNYFEILEDTLLGFRIYPWNKGQKRKSVETEKFYLFDIGVCNYLTKRKPVPETPEYGFMFEHFILMELIAYKAYRDPEVEIQFWRTHTKQEVDFILNNLNIALEIKTSKQVQARDLKGLSAIYEENCSFKRIVISMESTARVVTDRYGKIYILPWEDFLKRLWSESGDGFDRL